MSELLKPWRESQERERAKEEESRKRNNLIYSALSYARTETRDWEREDADGALREVEEALHDETEGKWSLDDVRDLVDEILNEWDYE